MRPVYARLWNRATSEIFAEIFKGSFRPKAKFLAGARPSATCAATKGGSPEANTAPGVLRSVREPADGDRHTIAITAGQPLTEGQLTKGRLTKAD